MKYKTKKIIKYIFLFFTTIVLLSSLSLFLNFHKKIIKQSNTVIKIDTSPNIEFFFNNEGENHDLNQIISEQINASQKSLEIAVYSIKSEKIKKSIYDAYNRGVKVDLIFDYHKKSDHDEFFSDLPAGINRIDLGHSWPNKVLMHHKFAIIDRGQAEEKLIFGDFNWTDLQSEYDRDFILISNEKNIINTFGEEFLRLKNKISGPDKLNLNNYNSKSLQLEYSSEINNEDTTYEIWFSPGSNKENINQLLINKIDKAKKNIKIMMWSFTNKSIATKLLEKAKAGVNVQIIGDGLNFYNEYSVFNYILKEKKENNIENITILSAPYIIQNKNSEELFGPREIESFLHHHSIIIDDTEVIFGTNNWSTSGTYYNDEATIFTNSSEAVSNFSKSHNYNLSISKIID